MAAPTTPRRPAFISSVVYRDNRAALEWLQRVFGFDIAHVLTDSKGNIVHAEMSHGDGTVMIGTEWYEWTKSPASVGGMNTQRIHVRLESGIDEHYEHARAAGATTLGPPQDQFYGDRTYAVKDPEGHHWTFAQTVRNVSNEEMEKATGFKFKEGL
jgi:uncharacterized glyoxalase superfamily protein PhnB